MYQNLLTERTTDIYYDLYDAQLNREWELADELLNEIVYLEKQEKKGSRNAQKYIGEVYI